MFDGGARSPPRLAWISSGLETKPLDDSHYLPDPAVLGHEIVEDLEAALAWLESLGYAVKHGPDITPGGDTLTPTLSQWGRESYAEVVLEDPLLEALVRFNPTLPVEAIDDEVA